MFRPLYRVIDIVGRHGSPGRRSCLQYPFQVDRAEPNALRLDELLWYRLHKGVQFLVLPIPVRIDQASTQQEMTDATVKEANSDDLPDAAIGFHLRISDTEPCLNPPGKELPLLLFCPQWTILARRVVV